MDCSRNKLVRLLTNNHWSETMAWKINTIIAMLAPINIKQVQFFLGAVTFYGYMWPWHSHILTPLKNLTGKGTLMWISVHQQAFDAMKALMVEDVLLRYPDCNLLFHICKDAPNYQPGSVILQQNIPESFSSPKLSP